MPSDIEKRICKIKTTQCIKVKSLGLWLGFQTLLCECPDKSTDSTSGVGLGLDYRFIKQWQMVWGCKRLLKKRLLLQFCLVPLEVLK